MGDSGYKSELQITQVIKETEQKCGNGATEKEDSDVVRERETEQTLIDGNFESTNRRNEEAEEIDKYLMELMDTEEEMEEIQSRVNEKEKGEEIPTNGGKTSRKRKIEKKEEEQQSVEIIEVPINATSPMTETIEEDGLLRKEINERNTEVGTRSKMEEQNNNVIIEKIKVASKMVEKRDNSDIKLN